MPKFTRSSTPGNGQTAVNAQRAFSREELDTKHLAALEAKSIISWKSPVRVFKARSQKYFVKVALYGLILAVMFVVYVLATHAPDNIEHKITNMGIITGSKAFLWEELDSFWFDKKGDDRLLMVQTKLRFPTRLIILLTAVSERALLDLLDNHLHYHPGPVHTLFDKWANYLQQRINLE